MQEPNSSSTGSPGTPADSTDRSRQQHSVQQAHGDGSIVTRVKENATIQLSQQKDRGTDALGSVAQAVRSSTQRLRNDKHDTIASYVDKAADQIETWSRQLKEKDVDELVTDVQRLARRQPAVFIGSAFALGLVGARFFKSSGEQNEPASGSESRRALYGGGGSMSTAGDRGGRRADVENEVAIGEIAIGTEQVSNSDVDPLDTDTPSTGADNRNARGRKSNSRTGRT